MPVTQFERAERFAALHAQPGHFLIGNAWDLLSARLLAASGFPALATSSAACAWVYGLTDGQTTRNQAFAHAAGVVEATDLPVAADMEKGYGDSPEDVRATIFAAAAAGLVGGSIEDSTGNPKGPIFPLDIAVSRIQAAVRARDDLSFPFTLTARCENFVHNRNDLGDTIKRLQAFEEAGADVLFAPALPDLESIQAVCASVGKPVNFMVTITNRSFSVAELADAGVKRISFASSLCRAAMSALIDVSTEIVQHGTFNYLNTICPSKTINDKLSEARPPSP